MDRYRNVGTYGPGSEETNQGREVHYFKKGEMKLDCDYDEVVTDWNFKSTGVLC